MTTRREFIAGLTAGAATAIACDTSPRDKEEIPELSFGSARGESTIFGRTGIRTSRIGFGAAHFTTNKTKEEATRLVHTILDEGINLIDTAWNYGKDMASWRYLGEVFKDRKRDDFIISNKLEWREGRPEITEKSVEEQIDEALAILNVDYFDIYHIHNLYESGCYEKCVDKGFIEDMIPMREKGKIRYLGISGHSHPDMISMCKRYPEIDVVLGGMNIMREYYYFDYDARHLNDYAKRNNLGILSMKPFLMGALTRNQPAALKYAMTQPNSVPIPGMTEIEHVTMNVKAAREFSALSPEAQQSWKDPETILEQPACTGCKYCINGDSDDINVPQLVMAAQYGERFGLRKWQSKDQRRKKLAGDLKKITPIMAGRYARKCPRELPVEELLKKSAQYI
ncbi:MAG: aldo/keto reductase [Candidatus Latescibacteria bacterium]|jgi:uncharacterized protein|nr:aldo/keto reductase [Candidatus Latescibacterota bacterium]